MTMKGTLYLFGIAAWCYVVSACDVDFKGLRSCPAGMTDDGINCWKHTYGRGTGRSPSVIRCPSGLRDDGTSCWRDAHIYGKPCCCTLWGCCRGRCRSGYTDDGCTCRKTNVGVRLTYFERLRCRSSEDLYGSLCYPKCRTGYHAVGCCLCEPNGGPGIKVLIIERLSLGISNCLNINEVNDRVSEELGRSLQPQEKLNIAQRYSHLLDD